MFYEDLLFLLGSGLFYLLKELVGIDDFDILCIVKVYFDVYYVEYFVIKIKFYFGVMDILWVLKFKKIVIYSNKL